jgi:hypothetical protein
MSGTASSAFLIIPTSEAPSQEINTTLANQDCTINLYTKSINVPIESEIPVEPPVYQNTNPCFIDLYVSGVLIIGGVYVRQSSLVVRDTYFGFNGDLSVIDTSGAAQDPFGVPPRLPPAYLKNPWQRSIPLSFGEFAPNQYGGRIPGMGTRWILTYWPVGSYTPGYPPPQPTYALPNSGSA